MKHLFIYLLLLLPVLGFTQSNYQTIKDTNKIVVTGTTEGQEITYGASTVEMITVDATTGKVISTKPLGYKVAIIYNTFFKSYKVIYEGPDYTITNYYIYEGTDANGNVIYSLKNDNTKRFYFSSATVGDFSAFVFTHINPAHERLNNKIVQITISGVIKL